MHVRLEENLNQEDIEVLIKYAQRNRIVDRLEALVRSVDKTVSCQIEDRECWIGASEIYYIESVDKRTFVYCEKLVYRTEHRLYQLAESLHDAGFIQVSKSCLLDIQTLESIRPKLNSRMEATLTNGERINVTRKFIPLIKEKLLERGTV